MQRSILLYRYFEEYDFATKSLDYIMSASDLEHIRNLAVLPLFAYVENAIFIVNMNSLMKMSQNIRD